MAGREAGGGGGVAQQGGNSPAGLSIPPPTQGFSPWGQGPMGPAQTNARSINPTGPEDQMDQRNPGIGTNNNTDHQGNEREVINLPSSRSGGRHSREKETIDHLSSRLEEPLSPPAPSPPESVVSMFSEADTETESKREGNRGSLVTHAGAKQRKGEKGVG